MKIVLEKFPDGNDNDEKKITSEKKRWKTQSYYWNETEMHWDALDKVMEECPDDTISSVIEKGVNNEDEYEK